jgi:hypothetical protein
VSEEHGGDSFEEKLRALAREVSESVERVAGRVDRDELADRIGAGGERLRDLAEFAGRWLTDQAKDPQARAEQVVARLRAAGPHPRDLPTEEQGLALSALDSGRWKVEPGTDELTSDGEGPAPGERVGIVSELRARDWITADGEVTLLGRAALKRWEEGATPGSEG